MMTGHLPLAEELLTGRRIILVFYALILGGRSWCAWVCPINMVTDLAAWLRRRLGISDLFRLSRNIRYTVLALALVLSALTGVAAFEWISPISMLHRELIFGVGLGWTAVLGVSFCLTCLSCATAGAATSARWALSMPCWAGWRRCASALMRPAAPTAASAPGFARNPRSLNLKAAVRGRHDRLRRMQQLRPLHQRLPGGHPAVRGCDYLINTRQHSDTTEPRQRRAA